MQIVEKNMASTRKADELFTVKDAYEYLINADTLRYNKNVLQQCNLNDYIAANLTYDKEKSETSRKELLGEHLHGQGAWCCAKRKSSTAATS